MRNPFVLWLLFSSIFMSGCSSKSPALKIHDEAVKLQNLGKFDEAKVLFKKAIESDSNFYEAYLKYGYIYEKERKTDSAVFLYNMAIAIDPNNGKAYLYRGVSLLGDSSKIKEEPEFESNPDAAISDFDKALELGYDPYAVYYNRAVAYERLGDKGNALSDYKSFIIAYEKSVGKFNKLFKNLEYPFNNSAIKARDAINRLEKDLSAEVKQ